MTPSDASSIALYPGSFDTPTNGHLNLIERAARLFRELTVAVANNTAKDPLLSVDERVSLLTEITAGMHNVRVTSFDGLTVEYARQIGAGVVVRGLRAVSDFEFELQMALMNKRLAPEIETIYLAPESDHSFLSSSIVREVLRLGGDIHPFVPPAVERRLLEKLANEPGFAHRLGRE